MPIKKYAGIDIGSNATRLIINDLLPAENDKFVLEKRVYIRLPLRIGYDVFTSGKIKKEMRHQFLYAMKIFKDILNYNGVTCFRACATAAMRNADNQAEILNYIRLETDINIEVIDGFEEAELLYLINREKLGDKKYFISADMGGGSLQLAVFNYDQLIWAHAFKTGTLRFLTGTVLQYEIDALEQKILELKQEYPDAVLMGSGGNINKISKIIQSMYAPYKEMKSLHKELKNMSFIDRIKKYTLREDRADVIVPALALYLRLMKLTGSETIYVPKTGLADGIIRELFLRDYDIAELNFK
jgi:exopolyphosphatase/guanosine-5'-triphosphate,3'-diphosphate pyrophosphatase